MPTRINRTISRGPSEQDGLGEAGIAAAAAELARVLRPMSVLQVGGPESLADSLRGHQIDAAFAPALADAPAGGDHDLVILFGLPDAGLSALAPSVRRILFCPSPPGRRRGGADAPLLAALGRLGEAGFAPSPDVDVSFVTPRALLLERSEDRDAARAPTLLAAELSTLRGRVADLVAQTDRMERRLGYSEGPAAAPERALADAAAAHRAFLNADHARRVATERLQQIEASTSWRLTAPLRRLVTASPRARLALLGPAKLVWWTVTLQLPRRLRARREFFRARAEALQGGQALSADAPIAAGMAEPVDIIVCVHNALEDVQRCLASVLAGTLPPYRLIIVDDGSAEPTRDFLAGFAAAHGAVLERNEAARGYTFAANQGMRLATAPWVVLLNSDTIVTIDWLDRMLAAGADPKVGAVGPMSNIASWQSVPRIAEGGDWPENPLPDDIDVARMGRLVADASRGQAIPLPFLNGFCMLLRKAMLDQIGLFDEQTFGAGYGEENDLCIRARIAGWGLVAAADVFVFHTQSKSYSNERRFELAKRADAALTAKHDPAVHVWPQVAQCQRSRAMAAARARTEAAIDRFRLIAEGRRRWEGLRIAIIIPTLTVGGGPNVIFQEAEALRRMGVDAWLINLDRFLGSFEASYPGLDLPVIYAKGEDDFTNVVADPAYGFDAVIATFYKSVFWMPPASPTLRRAYYIQDYEPLFFDMGDPEREIAFQSYQHADDIVMLTKTHWNADQVESAVTPRPVVLGPSVDLDRFRPSAERGPDGPVRVCAMVRPWTPRRGPGRTLAVLRQLKTRFGAGVEITVFGANESQASSTGYDFGGMTNLGEIGRAQVAEVLGRNDVFLDLSDYQAMGLTALEAMASGCAVVLPVEGGAGDFAHDQVNSLVIDTTDLAACHAAAHALVADGELRRRLQMRAIADVRLLTPESVAFRMMEALFGEEEGGLAAASPRP